MENILRSFCCVLKPPQAAPEHAFELLNSTIFALDIRCRAIYFRCKEHLLRAKQFRAEGDMIRCKAELQQRFQLEQTYKRFVNLYTNVCRVRDSLDETSAVGTIASNIGVANRALEEALKSVDPEKIEALMEQLDEGTHQMHEVSSILGRNEEYDEEEALALLDRDEEEAEINLPELPVRQDHFQLEEEQTQKTALLEA